MSPAISGERVMVEVEDDGEITNQRTEDPIFAALYAATSPIPPGGDMTTIFPDDDMYSLDCL